MKTIVCRTMTSALNVSFLLLCLMTASTQVHAAVELLLQLDDEQEATQSCSQIRRVNGVLVGLLQTAEHGCEPWALSGPGAPKLLLDIYPGPGSSEARFRGNLFKGWQLFVAEDGTHGSELWRTNGTTVEMVADIYPGGSPSNLFSFVRLPDGGRIYFNATLPLDNGGQGTRLMSYDGSSVRDEFEAAGASLVGTYNGPVNLGNSLFFMAWDEEHGLEPRLFDGENFTLIADSVPGEGSVGTSGFLTIPFQSGIFMDGDVQTPQGWVKEFYRSTETEIVKLPKQGLDYPGQQTDYVWSIINDGKTLFMSFQPFFALEHPTKILRLSEQGWSIFELPNMADDESEPHLFYWRNQAYALVENVFYKLNASSAQEVEPPFEGLPQSADLSPSSGYHTSVNRQFNATQNGETTLWDAGSKGSIRLEDENGDPLTDAVGFRNVDFLSGDKDFHFFASTEERGQALWKLKDAFLDGPINYVSAVSGSWYDPARGGQGFTIQTSDQDTGVFYFYGYRDDGSPLWLIGVASQPVVIGQAQWVTMYSTSGGDFGSFNPGDIHEEEWGVFEVTFQDCRHATAHLEGQDGEQDFDLVLLAGIDGLGCQIEKGADALTAGISGSWYEQQTSGQGFFLHTLGEDRIVVYFYGYANESERLWLIGVHEGGIELGESMDIPMNVTDGGTFTNYESQNITESPWGHMSIRFEDCSTAVATLTGVNGEQSLDLVKLVQINGTLLNCD